MLARSFAAVVSRFRRRFRKVNGAVQRGDADGVDSWEAYFGNVPEALPFAGVFTFSYDNGEGSYTVRTVEALRIIPRPNKLTLFGFCRTTHQYRHFNLSRAREMVDAESGETIADPSIDLMQLWNSSEFPETLRVIQEHAEEIVVLIYACRSAAILSDSGTAAIEEFLRAVAAKSISRHEIARRIARWPEITNVQFERSLRSLTKRPPEIRSAVISALEKALATDHAQAMAPSIDELRQHLSLAEA